MSSAVVARAIRLRQSSRFAEEPVAFRLVVLGTAPSALNAHRPGEIDYRLSRQSLISEFRKGRIARNEVCDAHPELRRNAAALGMHTERACPICEESALVMVTYVFGPRLPASGRCISKRNELAGINRRAGSFAGYVVEVCTECWWNHLIRSFLLGRGATSGA